ncbi:MULTISPECIES: hypothetical protein [unclassified Streptomyces]|uniref:hypothetical protein n=1 Tax=unclassified Streptomyces TaxID=2593676 RepID=UPI003664A7AE
MRPSASVRKGVRGAVPGAVSVLVAVVCAGGALTGCTGAVPEPKSTADAVPTPPPIVTRTPAPSTPPTSPEGAEEFGPVVARDGDVSAHAAVREAGGVLRVPVSVTNRGSVRAFYEVTVRVTGPDGYDATGSFTTDTVGVYPGASWPTGIQVSMPGRAAPAEPKVEIARVEVDRH